MEHNIIVREQIFIGREKNITVREHNNIVRGHNISAREHNIRHIGSYISLMSKSFVLLLGHQRSKLMPLQLHNDCTLTINYGKPPVSESNISYTDYRQMSEVSGKGFFKGKIWHNLKVWKITVNVFKMLSFK